MQLNSFAFVILKACNIYVIPLNHRTTHPFSYDKGSKKILFIWQLYEINYTFHFSEKFLNIYLVRFKQHSFLFCVSWNIMVTFGYMWLKIVNTKIGMKLDWLTCSACCYLICKELVCKLLSVVLVLEKIKTLLMPSISLFEEKKR